MLKILFIASGNFPNPYQNFFSKRVFIGEQINSLRNEGIQVDLFLIQGKGVSGYFKNVSNMHKKVSDGQYDLIHAHYGISGFFARFATIKPLIITYHGSDINSSKINIISSFAMLISTWNIFVSQGLFNKSFIKTKRSSIIPCGVDLDVFFPSAKINARIKLGLNSNKTYALFASSFANPVKNYPLAKNAVEKINSDIELVELKNRSREEVNDLLNAVDFLLLTSFSEGSPQIIKEAMACNCPIVATDVGDIRWLVGEEPGHFISNFDIDELSLKIINAIHFSNISERTNGRSRIIDLKLDSKSVTRRLIEVYNLCVRSKSD